MKVKKISHTTGYGTAKIWNSMISSYWWPPKPRISEAPTSKVGTLTFNVVKPIHFTSMTLCCSEWFIFAKICNIFTYQWPSKPKLPEAPTSKVGTRKIGLIEKIRSTSTLQPWGGKVVCYHKLHISLYSWPPKPRISESLLQKWVLEKLTLEK